MIGFNVTQKPPVNIRSCMRVSCFAYTLVQIR